jgi:cell division protein FtsQ
MYPPISSQEELRQRRRQLRQQRRVRTVKVLWQLTVIGGLVGGITWAVCQPDWVIRQPQQIQIRGNQFLSANAVRTMLNLKYPISLLHIEPQVLKAQLVSQGHITAATIDRELIPPRLTVRVQDISPVAMADKPARQGLVDEYGHWLPLTSYQVPADRLPKLKLLLVDDMCPEWPELYQAVSQSPVQVSEINCRNPFNLMLKTEIGTLRLGPFEHTKVYKQLQEAHKLRNWQQQYQHRFTSITDVAYIDLENPTNPRLQLNITNSTKTPGPVP